MNTPKRVAVYLRVSTQDQSTELQSREIDAYLKARGYTQVQVYEDKATGTNANRQMLKSLMSDARARKFDAVVVWKLDRFARSLKDLISLLHELSELGVEFVSLKDQIDLTTSAGRLMLHMLGAFAEFEASLIRERVRAGIQHARKNGIQLGRPRRLNVQLAKDLRGNGLTLSQIALELQTTKSAISKCLKRAI